MMNLMRRDMEKRLCCIFNYAPHYRESIYSIMDDELGCDFYFGENLPYPLKKMDMSILKGFKSEVKNIFFKHTVFSWRKGIFKLAFRKKYSEFFILFEPTVLSNWILLVLCKLLNKKVYSWGHGIKSLTENMFLYKMFFNITDGLFLYGKHAKENMINLGFSPNKMHIIYNSLDYNTQLSVRNNLTNEKILACRKSLFYDTKIPILIFIGRLTKVKRLDILLEAHSLLNKSGVLINTLLVGDGEEKGYLQEHCLKLGISNNVKFYGESYDEDKNGLLISSSDICISPGNVGLTAIHSLMFGTPVITHNRFELQMPEFEAIRPGLTGDFFEFENSNDLVRKILIWLPKLRNERKLVRMECYKVVDEVYNPYNQIKILKSIISHNSNNV